MNEFLDRFIDSGGDSETQNTVNVVGDGFGDRDIVGLQFRCTPRRLDPQIHWHLKGGVAQVLMFDADLRCTLVRFFAGLERFADALAVYHDSDLVGDLTRRILAPYNGRPWWC